MTKLPSFQFYPGDWMKDPELRRCSLFARGLLVDLLCLMFEQNPRGCLCELDEKTPWPDADIVSAISGGTENEKLGALQELERKGVLSRDEHGVLLSRRMVRDEKTRQERALAGSKGGSKTQAKRKQTIKQKQSSSSSSSPSGNKEASLSKRGKGETPFDPTSLELPPELSGPHFRSAWLRWCQHRKEINKKLTPQSTVQQIKQLAQWGESWAICCIDHTIEKGWQGIREPDSKTSSAVGPHGEAMSDED